MSISTEFGCQALFFPETALILCWISNLLIGVHTIRVGQVQNFFFNFFFWAGLYYQPIEMLSHLKHKSPLGWVGSDRLIQFCNPHSDTNLVWVGRDNNDKELRRR